MVCGHIPPSGPAAEGHRAKAGRRQGSDYQRERRVSDLATCPCWRWPVAPAPGRMRLLLCTTVAVLVPPLFFLSFPQLCVRDCAGDRCQTVPPVTVLTWRVRVRIRRVGSPCLISPCLIHSKLKKMAAQLAMQQLQKVRSRPGPIRVGGGHHIIREHTALCLRQTWTRKG